MSFRTGPVVGARAIEVVRQSLLQSDSLPFADVLSTAQMQQVFEAEGVSFGERAGEADGVVYTPTIMLWARLSQMFMTGTQRSCRAAVARVAAFFTLLGRVISRNNTGLMKRAKVGGIGCVEKGAICCVSRLPDRPPSTNSLKNWNTHSR